MAEIDKGKMYEGIDAAVNRAKNDFPDEFPDLPPDFFDVENRVLEQWPDVLSPRFVKLFIELVAIATISRTKYEHPPLTTEEKLGFLGHIAAFLNSWTHQ